jgi:DNA-binding protein H-NS
MKISASALRDKISQLQKQLADLESNKVAHVRKVKTLMEQLGVTVADLTTPAAAPAKQRKKPGSRRPSTGRTVPVKYEDGQGHSWSGRGKSPRWLVEAEAAGASRDQFLVNR